MNSYSVWDPFVRVFHWSVAALFLVNLAITDPESALHADLGYLLGALVALRILWGLVGPTYARFASFLPSHIGVGEQISDIALRRNRIHLGHTPLGALMIVNLLLSLMAIVVTGYMMTTLTFFGVDWVEAAHEAFVTWAEISVVIHVSAVLLESARSGVNLVGAMITGVKRVPRDARVER